MKYDVIISGVGGQGILAIATVLGRACLLHGLNIKQAEVHGMAQRGGAVQSHFRMSTSDIHSDVIAKNSADMILSMEPMESLRYLPWISKDGWLVTNSEAVINIPDYPNMDEVNSEIAKIENNLVFDGTSIAKEFGSSKGLNMAMLGAASAFIDIPEELFIKAIKDQFASKREDIIEGNVNTFVKAREVALERKNKS